VKVFALERLGQPAGDRVAGRMQGDGGAPVMDEEEDS